MREEGCGLVVQGWTWVAAVLLAEISMFFAEFIIKASFVPARPGILSYEDKCR